MDKEKYKITKEELIICNECKTRGFIAIGRDYDGILRAFSGDTKRGEDYWRHEFDSEYIFIDDEKFSFISFFDDDPVIIQDILNNYIIIGDENERQVI